MSKVVVMARPKAQVLDAAGEFRISGSTMSAAAIWTMGPVSLRAPRLRFRIVEGIISSGFKRRLPYRTQMHRG